MRLGDIQTNTRENKSIAPPPVLVSIVTYNSADVLDNCLKSLLTTASYELGRNLFIRITDNASTDASFEIARTFASQHNLDLQHPDPQHPEGQLSNGQKSIELVLNPINLGFARAHNFSFSRAAALGIPYVLVLNPDVALTPNALINLVTTLGQDNLAGLATPKLLNANPDLTPCDRPLIDSTGVYFSTSFRHFDRGQGELDVGQYNTTQYVAGATGAVTLFKLCFLQDIALRNSQGDDSYSLATPESPLEQVTEPSHEPLSNVPPREVLQVYDNLYFAYREDAELSLRALLYGWRCLYVAEALGYHVRLVTPQRRRELNAEINAWSVRNRFLMQISHFAPRLIPACFVPTMLRNLLVIGGVLTKERTSLPALKSVLALRARAKRIRQEIQQRRRVGWRELIQVFREGKRYSRTCLKRIPPTISQTGQDNREDEALPTEVLVIFVNYNSGTRLAAALRYLDEHWSEHVCENCNQHCDQQCNQLWEQQWGQDPNQRRDQHSPLHSVIQAATSHDTVNGRSNADISTSDEFNPNQFNPEQFTHKGHLPGMPNHKRHINSSNTSYNQQVVTRQCHPRITVAIYDNASHDGSANIDSASYRNFTPLTTHSPVNHGFAGAINRCITSFTETAASPPEQLLILNPDILITASCINSLAAASSRYTNLGLVAPLLVDNNGHSDFSYSARRIPDTVSTLLELFGLHRSWPNNPWTTDYYYRDDKIWLQEAPHYRHPFPIEQPAGAAILIDYRAWQQLDGFDTAFYPAWFEDVDFCLRLEQAGWATAVLPTTHAIHEGGYSLKALKSEQFLTIWYRNLFYFYKKHDTAPMYYTLRLIAAFALLLRAARLLIHPTLAPGSTSSRYQLCLQATKSALARIVKQ